MLTTQGTLKVEPHKGRIVVEVSNDFVNYYNWFITKKYWIKFATPMYGAHVTVANTKFHPRINWQKAMYHNNKPVNLDYDEYIIRGGQMKGFDLFYVKVHSAELDALKRKLGIVEKDSYKGLHITISNSKGTLPDYWPQMIELYEKDQNTQKARTSKGRYQQGSLHRNQK